MTVPSANRERKMRLWKNVITNYIEFGIENALMEKCYHISQLILE